MCYLYWLLSANPYEGFIITTAPEGSGVDLENNRDKGLKMQFKM